ncbi:hypothetical protein QPL79_05215 [Ignisphaera sp. 4213-co]|uniref:Uncharacterized protein n=1 Tax=Ignisphaera cupida TaxID=3050454 RepID=A0ABD4Z624_9CREN|nr:hypothetical protein [Ignisphaera sp. 4213-co]MDK6028756.1 hypothetical protein [Ignisphaera sp. 4213-co]
MRFSLTLKDFASWKRCEIAIATKPRSSFPYLNLETRKQSLANIESINNSLDEAETY